MNRTTEILLNAKSTIMNKDNWCQGRFEDDQGRKCAMGAIGYNMKILHGDPDNTLQSLNQAVEFIYPFIRKLYPEMPVPSLVTLNDDKGFEAVHKVFDAAIQASLEQDPVMVVYSVKAAA